MDLAILREGPGIESGGKKIKNEKLKMKN